VLADDIALPDERVHAILRAAGFGSDLFNPTQHRSCELVERYVLEHAIALVGALGVADLLAKPVTVQDVLDTLGFVPGFRLPLRWLLERLVAADLLDRDGIGRYRLRAPLPSPLLAQTRAAGFACDPSYTPAYAVADEAAALYPRIARGEAGEQALFRKLGLWSAYFSNEHRYYALNNHVAARAASDRFVGGTILEVGAGLGSGTEALLDLLRERDALARIAAYRMTEPVVFFRRRALRVLEQRHPAVPLAAEPLDVNQPWRSQGIPAGSATLVWGVNVFHLSRDLPAVLGEAREALAPGGWLVVGEGIRPFVDRPVGAEFPFQVLESYLAVETDPDTRPTPGFLTAEHWLRALTVAGFADVTLVPDVVRLRDLQPAFYAAAVCGRRV
jgi:SAM-dependent methyltransferase